MLWEWTPYSSTCELYCHRLIGTRYQVTVEYERATNCHILTMLTKESRDETIVVDDWDFAEPIDPENPFGFINRLPFVVPLKNRNEHRLWEGVCKDIIDFRMRNEKTITDESRIPKGEA